MRRRSRTASLALALATAGACTPDSAPTAERSGSGVVPQASAASSTPAAATQVCPTPVPAMLELERELVERVNQLRKSGGSCSAALDGKEPALAATPPLVDSPQLTCAARLNSEDMARTGHFAHRNLAQQGPEARSRQAGYTGRGVLENLAWGQVTPAAVTGAWLGSREHCLALFSRSSSEIGVGVATGPGGKRFWTLLLGTK